LALLVTHTPTSHHALSAQSASVVQELVHPPGLAQRKGAQSTPPEPTLQLPAPSQMLPLTTFP
jgi:hypothetical protein